MRKYLFTGTVLLITVLAFSLGRVGAKNIFTKVLDSSFRGMQGGVMIKESGGVGERVINGAYILVEGKLKETPTDTVSITINKGEDNEYSFDLVKVVRNGKVVSVRPGKEGGPLHFKAGINKVIFTDQYHKSLWVADIADLEPRNIQPELVGDISQKNLFAKKEDLARQGKDTDEYILYWVSAPILSPDENKIVFASNRLGYPSNFDFSLWLTDLQGNTQLLVDETDKGSVIPVAWANSDKVVYQGPSGELKYVNVHTGETKIVVDERVAISSSSPDGKYIIYNPVRGGIIQPELHVLDTEKDNSYLVTLPEGYKTNGFYGWGTDNESVAFYVQDFNGNIKLMIMHCSSVEVISLDAPENTSFDEDVIPFWSDGRVLFSAGGKLYSYGEVNKYE
ncbi:hypothetical protein SY88_21270 [Clostridiales bacterium PH28_bin88]|nr:hypothetical protein SY88_21270 [Clostridiales bacterium PH28_bin88]